MTRPRLAPLAALLVVALPAGGCATGYAQVELGGDPTVGDSLRPQALAPVDATQGVLRDLGGTGDEDPDANAEGERAALHLRDEGAGELGEAVIDEAAEEGDGLSEDDGRYDVREKITRELYVPFGPPSAPPPAPRERYPARDRSR